MPYCRQSSRANKGKSIKETWFPRTSNLSLILNAGDESWIRRRLKAKKPWEHVLTWCWMHETARKLTHDTDVWELNKFKAPPFKLNSIEKNCFIIHSMHADKFLWCRSKSNYDMQCWANNGVYHVILYASCLYVEGIKTTMMMMHTYLSNEGEETGNKELYFAIYSIMHTYIFLHVVIFNNRSELNLN